MATKGERGGHEEMGVLVMEGMGVLVGEGMDELMVKEWV